MSGRYAVRPLSDHTWMGQTRRENSRFRSDWAETVNLLVTEVEHLKGRDLVLEIDVNESDLRLDGELRANARPASDAVRVAFESKHGPLLYRCDRYYTEWFDQGPAWQHNVRAIAKTLEALRAVDRYGATETGQQYTGYKALGAGSGIGLASGMTMTEALGVITHHAGVEVDGAVFAEVSEQMVRAAKIKTHPDRHGGSRVGWNDVEEAERVLRRSGKVVS